jgi:hypothetical protein
VLEYTLPSKTIDSDNLDIIALSNSLASGEDDLFIVAYKFADWTKRNVQYNLTTLTESASEPASWVLANKEGVCDEITNLFIALCRSVGIPARFVSGIAYTESDLFTERWGPHGWAEVYFPGYGWVDYDVTYGEFGFIDPTHLKLKDTIDPQEPSVKYNWLGYNVDLKTKQVNTKVSLKKYSPEIPERISMTIFSERAHIAFNSYNLIGVHLVNNNNFYVAEQIELSKTKEIEVEGELTKTVVLEPNQEKYLYWIINVGELDTHYIYTFPVAARNLRNTTTQSSFKASREGSYVGKGEILELLSSREQEQKKAYSRNVSLECGVDKAEFYAYEENKAECIARNLGNAPLDGITACLGIDCRKFDLGISQEKKMEFEVNDTVAGRKQREVMLKSKYAAKSFALEYTLYDEPKINVSIVYPKNVTYNEMYNVELLLEKKSFSVPYETEVLLKQGPKEKTWTIGDMDKDRKILIEMKGSDLLNGENLFSMMINYNDSRGKRYEQTNEFAVTLYGLNSMEIVQDYLKRGSRFVLTPQGITEFIVVMAISFAIITLIVFRKKSKKNDRLK